MYKYMLLIFLSLGIHSHFVPLKITTSHLPHNISAVVEEIINSLNNTHKNFTEKFLTPTNIKCPTCSHKYANEFIRELHKINNNEQQNKHNEQLLKVEIDMEKLKNICPFLKKTPDNDSSCEIDTEPFDMFKKELVAFVSWINEENICNTTQKMDKVDTCLQNITVLP